MSNESLFDIWSRSISYSTEPKYTYEYKPIKWNELKRRPRISLTKCVECIHCIEPGDGIYRCKYGKGGRCNADDCHYERKHK